LKYCQGVTNPPTKAPFFLFGGLCDQFIIKKEPMNREDSHKSIGSATMRLALDE